MMERKRDQPGGSVPRSVDAVVIGGGHAGIEAAVALARHGHSVALVTFDAAGLGRVSCNPSIGGLAKGQLVREIDALGGCMGRLADRAGIHFRMLNRRKGPAVRAPRAQVDTPSYMGEAQRALRALPTLQIVEGEVTDIRVEGDRGAARRVCGVHVTAPRVPTPPAPLGPRVLDGQEIATRAVVLAPGTFLEGMLFTGMEPRPGGRRAESPADALASSLRHLGLRLGRLKTGTPPRLHRDSIDVSRLTPQPGDEPPPRFSFFEPAPVANRVLCYLTRTSAATHAAVRAGLDRSPLYGGLIRGVGPRYCPSIEDKVVRFPERTSHQVFLEPEGLDSACIYPNGISTSLPADVQASFLHTIPGLEAAQIVHPGYAVEYSFLLTSQLEATLQVRGIEGLYAAGQINGTSGYEEAAAQGLLAGLNARAWVEDRPPVILRRDEAYIGVLVDDLITKTPAEPYRMFTSQSEYRLILRQDNADLRLWERGREVGALTEVDAQRIEARRVRVAAARARLRAGLIGREELAAARATGGLGSADTGKSFEEILKRPAMSMEILESLGAAKDLDGLSELDRVTLEADIKYDGYVRRLREEVRRLKALEGVVIPPALLDNPPDSLSREAREVLRERRPRTLAQAARVPGITPCDVSILAIRIRSLTDANLRVFVKHYQTTR
jgi:tRNA uridine 5-carboxymethylaminomethyl modification enzyme